MFLHNNNNNCWAYNVLIVLMLNCCY